MYLSKSAESSAGVDLEKDYIVRFYPTSDITKPIFVSSIPANNATGVNPNTSITLNFSKGISYSSIASGITITPSFVYTISQNPGQDTIVITPAATLPNGSYQILMNQNLKDLSGNVLYQSASLSFVIGSDFTAPTISAVNSVSLSTPASPTVSLVDGLYTTGADKNSYLDIQFSEPMDSVATDGSVSISPSAYYNRQWITPSLIRLFFTPVLLPETYYKVTISTQAKDISSNPLNKIYSYGFITNAANSTIPITPKIYQSNISGSLPLPQPQSGCDGIAPVASTFQLSDLTGYATLNLGNIIDTNLLSASSPCVIELVLSFNTPMDRNSFLPPNTSFNTVYDPSGSSFTIYSIQASGNDIKLWLTTDAVQSTGGIVPVYQLRLKSGLTGIKDTSGNTMANDFTMLFTF
jgi:hypothetical protein